MSLEEVWSTGNRSMLCMVTALSRCLHGLSTCQQMWCALLLLFVTLDCWADRDADDANKVILGTSKAGVYNVMITAKRSDICATTMCPQEVEYIPEKTWRFPSTFSSSMINAPTKANTWRKYLFRTSKRPARWPEGGRVYCARERCLRGRTDFVLYRKSGRSNGCSFAINLC